MKKYKTKPINYTGCHPVIAKALKRNEAIECKVWDGGRKHDEEKRYVTGYDDSGVYITSGVIEWDYAEPIRIGKYTR